MRVCGQAVELERAGIEGGLPSGGAGELEKCDDPIVRPLAYVLVDKVGVDPGAPRLREVPGGPTMRCPVCPVHGQV